MGKYYHFTTYENLEKIINEGLIPQTGMRCKSIGDDSYGVFLSKGMDYSIIMYSYVLNFYEKFKGAYGDKRIIENLTKLQFLNEYTERDSIDILKEQIKSIELIKNCGSFINYLGGPGCFLTVDGISCEYEGYPENCCYKDIIPPSKIGLVNLRNKITGEYVNSLIAVLSYFMSLYPVDYIINNVVDEVKRRVYQLYNEKYYTELSLYNPLNYDLVEIPLCNYKQDKVKTLK